MFIFIFRGRSHVDFYVPVYQLRHVKEQRLFLPVHTQLDSASLAQSSWPRSTRCEWQQRCHLSIQLMAKKWLHATCSLRPPLSGKGDGKNYQFVTPMTKRIPVHGGKRNLKGLTMKAVNTTVTPGKLLRKELSILMHKIYNTLVAKSTETCVHLTRVEHVAHSNLRLPSTIFKCVLWAFAHVSGIQSTLHTSHALWN